MKASDLTGQRFGRLMVIKRNGSDKFGNSAWLCKCECGNEKTVSSVGLKQGSTQSCGCLRLEGSNNRKHGKSNNRLYRIYANMKDRCYRPKHNRYKHYGAKGIIVCEEWLNDFQAFYDWAMANGYADNLSIDRIDNNGNYEPSNCRWATVEEQANNKSNNVRLEFKGRELTMAQWEKEIGLKRGELWRRIYEYHWTIEKALSTRN